MGPSSLQVRGLGLILAPIWSILGRSWLQVGRSWPDFGSKLEAKMLQKSILRRSDKVFLVFILGSDIECDFVPIWLRFGSQNRPKMEPNQDQNPSYFEHALQSCFLLKTACRRDGHRKAAICDEPASAGGRRSCLGQGAAGSCRRGGPRRLPLRQLPAYHAPAGMPWT